VLKVQREPQDARIAHGLQDCAAGGTVQPCTLAGGCCLSQRGIRVCICAWFQSMQVSALVHAIPMETTRGEIMKRLVALYSHACWQVGACRMSAGVLACVYGLGHCAKCLV
jgi:hypothetical protein